MNGRVCHLTTVHQARDVRIFLKMARSAARAGYETSLVAPGQADEVAEGVRILAIEPPRGRLARFLGGAAACLRRAVEADADLYHFHDPELIRVGLALRRRGKRVVYDVHESHAESMLDRAYLPPWARRLASRQVAAAERKADSCLDAIVAATPKIARQFQNPRTVLVQNYPLLGELDPPGGVPFRERARALGYVGGVSAVRGAHQMVDAIRSVEGAVLKVAGAMTPASLESELAARPGWAQVEHRGALDRPGVAAMLGECRGGVVLFHPLRNHVESQPNKLFEYMAAGLPVLGSDFPHWREIVLGHRCGELADPLDTAAVAEAMRRLVDDPARSEELGANGRAAVLARYNWGTQEAALLGLYRGLLADRTAA